MTVCAYLALLTWEDLRRASTFVGVVTPASASSFTDSLASFTPATPSTSSLPNPLDLTCQLREFVQKVEESTQRSLALIRKELLDSRPAAPLADTLPKCTPQNP